MDASCLVCRVNDVTIVAIYRPPSCKNINNFIDCLDNVLKISTSSVVLIGDINIDIKTDNNDNRSDDYLTCAATNGLFPAHLFPTRNSNCLDHILLKTDLKATTLVIESSITDHLPLLLSLQSRISFANSELTYTKSKTDRMAVIEDIKSYDWSPIFAMTDPNHSADVLVETISGIVKRHTRVYTIPRRKRNIKPWVTPGLLRCIRNRDRMHAKLKKSNNNQILHITYTRYRNFCNSLLRKLKHLYEKEQFLKAKNNIKATWEAVKNVANLQTKQELPTHLLKLSDSAKSSLNEINKYFASVGSNMASKINNPEELSKGAPSPRLSGPTRGNSMALIPVSENDVDSIILSLRSDCATGVDCIPTEILKATRCVLTPVITHVLNLSLCSGVFPVVFKKTLVHPIHKAGCREDVNNYRPISILSGLSKILERVLNKYLISFLETNGILASNQYGFRSGISTEDAVIALTNYVVQQIDKKRKCLAIFLDLSKAFDSIPIPMLLKKLERIGIRGLPLQIFTDYLCNRTQIISIGKHKSDECPVTFGVPQGSILGPKLFLIYINDLCTLTLKNCRIFTYADDTALVIDGLDWAETYRNAEIALSHVMTWLAKNLLTLNVTKTMYIPFAIRPNLCPPISCTLRAHNCNFQLNCNCPCLNITNTVKYLGIHIDQKLNWHPHINTLVSRMRKIIYVFKQLRKSADQDTLKLVYSALCQSILTYCLPVWGGASKYILLRAERAQRAIIKTMRYLPRRYPTEKLFADSQVLTVRQLYVLLSTLRLHSVRPLTETADRVKHRTFPVPTHKTTFAGRQNCISGPILYNTLNKKLNIFPHAKHICKGIIKSFLLSLSYHDTEELLCTAI